MAQNILRLPVAWLPDGDNEECVDVDAYVEDGDLVLAVLEDGRGQVRIGLDEFADLVEFVDRVSAKEESE